MNISQVDNVVGSREWVMREMKMNMSMEILSVESITEVEVVRGGSR
jgi:hypothetical protein